MCLYVEPDGRVLLRSEWPIKDTELKLVEQPEHSRVLRYTPRARLSTIEFLGRIVDLRDLPQDTTIPSDAKLVGLFNAHDIDPQVQEDLIPA